MMAGLGPPWSRDRPALIRLQRRSCSGTGELVKGRVGGCVRRHGLEGTALYADGALFNGSIKTFTVEEKVIIAGSDGG